MEQSPCNLEHTLELPVRLASRLKGRRDLAALLTQLREHRTLRNVAVWCSQQKPAREVVSVVAQDEFSQDLVVRFDSDLYLAYDST